VRAAARLGAAEAALERWARGMRALALDLQRGRIGVRAWQDAAAAFGPAVDPAALLGALDLGRLAARQRSFGPGEHRIAIRLPGQAGEGPPAAELALLSAGRAVPPHGSNHLVTLHLVLRGHGRVRLYDRIADAEDAVFLRLADDRELQPGACFTGGHDAGNVRWLSAGATALLTLDLTVAIAAPAGFRQPSGRDGRLYLDPSGPAAADGAIRAVRLDPRRAMARFGSAS
jgi:hypothetical protein